jgi:predicted alpha/beta-fold hydrolase
LAIGFSLSGNALLLLLSEPSRGTPPDFAIAVNAPIHLDNTSVRLSQGLNRIYDVHFVRLMRQRMKEKIKHGLLHPYQYRLTGLNTLREFDEIYLAREAGFRNRQDYYEQCSTYDKLATVAVPTVMLTAEDDPFIDAGDYVRSRLSPMIHLHIERHGGHMGYLTQDHHPKCGRRWMDYALSEYIRAFFNLKSSLKRQSNVPHSKGTSTFPTF